MERPLVIDYWAGRRATQTECEAEVERLQAENALLRKVADIAWNVVETRGMSDVLLSELAGRLADWETWKEGEI
jgi:hypothetical protein